MTPSTRRLLPAFAALAFISFGCQSAPRQAPAPGDTQPASARPHEILITLSTSMGDLTLALDPLHAPISTGNFLNHAAKGHYDGTVFHRVVPGFVIQGGGWNPLPNTPDLADRSKAAKAAGEPDNPIINEWSTSGLKNTRGTIAFARDADPDTATREFYFNLADNPKLDTPRETTGRAGYAVFGRIIAGLDTLDRIAAVKTMPRPDLAPEDGGMKDVPVQPVLILGITRR